jgi:hypothetical protein
MSLALLTSGLVGCGTLASPSARGVPPGAIAQAYQQGVRDAHAQFAAETGSDPRATWVAPVVQEVWIPAQVVNGLFIPGHREWVVIHPAAWQRSSPIPAKPAPAGVPLHDRGRP